MAIANELIQENDALQAQLLEHENNLIRSTLESLDLTTSYVDPFERFRGPNGEMWEPLGAGGAGFSSLDLSNFRDTLELEMARNYCRLLARYNPFAICGHENRISYLIGGGHTYKVVVKKGKQSPPEMLAKVQAVIDEFTQANSWANRQQETVRRMDRDGEAFLRFFVNAEGCTRVRFVEPFQVATPATNPELAPFGIKTDPDDVETVLAYFVDGEEIDAGEIQHRKANVDCNVRRGCPTFFPVRQMLLNAVKVLNNIAKTSDIQTAIALIRRHLNGTKAGLTSMRTSNADYSMTSQTTGKTEYAQSYKAGAVIDANQNTEYDFPAAGLNVANYAAGVAAILRACAAMLSMPEFMFTADASNANLASTLAAEGPAVMRFQRDQGTIKLYDHAVMCLVICNAVEAGKLPIDIEDCIEVEIGCTTVKARNEVQEAQVADAEQTAGILSPQTRSQRAGLDYDQEQKNIAEHKKTNPPSAPPSPLAGSPGEAPAPRPFSEAWRKDLRKGSIRATTTTPGMNH